MKIPVGLTATNALSESFELISQRYKERAKIKFNDGVMETEEPVIEKMKKDLHGTTCIFKPSNFYLSKGDEIPTIPVKLLENWIRIISYTVPNDISIELQILDINGKTVVKDFDEFDSLSKFLVNEMNTKYLLKESVFLTGMTELVENYRGKDYNRALALDFSFNYDTNIKRSEEIGSQARTVGFCNFIHNDLGGTHINAAIDEIVHLLGKATRDGLSEAEGKRLKITKPDIITDLDLVINVSTNANPEFPAQTKGMVGSELIVPHIRQIIRDGLNKIFDGDPKLLKKLTDKIKTTAKSRTAANKEKALNVKKSHSHIDDYRMDKYSPALADRKNDYREIIFIEGDSAGGSADDGRFPLFQAIYALRGKPKNVLDGKMAEIISKNKEIREIVQIIRAGAGPNFKLEDAWFDKYIIMTDADTDGDAITSLLSLIFLMYFRPLVKAGMLYKACPPLYKLKGSNHKNPYIQQKSHYLKIFYKDVASHIKLITKDGNVMPDTALVQFMHLNKRYLSKLEKLSKFYAAHPHLMEFIAIHFDEKDFGKKLTKHFPEMKYEDGIVSGVYEGKFQIVNFINIKKRVQTIHDIAKDLNSGVYEYKVEYKTSDGSFKPLNDRLMYIGEILLYCEKFRPKVEQRFKGLGEMNSDVLKETTLDPNNRILIQLTCEDLEAELEKLKIMHSGTKHYAELRRQLVAEFEIDIDELDN